MGERPVVSVLMTAYNREKYIESAIKSVLASTLKDFELIIVDDRSTDRTVEIARGYQVIDSRVKVFVNEVNQGDYPNRNVAASYATGRYLKYVDADDLIYPWGLELLTKMMDDHQEAGWGLCSLQPDKSRIFPFVLQPSEAYRYHYFGPGLFHKAPLSAIIRKDIFDAVGGFSKMRMVGDFELWHRLGQRFPVLLMPQGMVWYRIHDSQEMNSYKKYLLNYVRITADYLTNENCPLSKDESARALSKIVSKKRREIIRSALKLRFSDVRSLNQQINELSK